MNNHEIFQDWSAGHEIIRSELSALILSNEDWSVMRLEARYTLGMASLRDNIYGLSDSNRNRHRLEVFVNLEVI